MRHGEAKSQVTGASGVLQVVDDLSVAAFLPILCAGMWRWSSPPPHRPRSRAVRPPVAASGSRRARSLPRALKYAGVPAFNDFSS